MDKPVVVFGIIVLFGFGPRNVGCGKAQQMPQPRRPVYLAGSDVQYPTAVVEYFLRFAQQLLAFGQFSQRLLLLGQVNGGSHHLGGFAVFKGYYFGFEGYDPDSAILGHDPVFVVFRHGAGLHKTVGFSNYFLQIVRVNVAQVKIHGQFAAGLRHRIVAEQPPHILRPRDFIGGHVPEPTAVAEYPFGFRQQGFTLHEALGGLLAGGDVEVAARYLDHFTRRVQHRPAPA